MCWSAGAVQQLSLNIHPSRLADRVVPDFGDRAFPHARFTTLEVKSGAALRARPSQLKHASAVWLIWVSPGEAPAASGGLTGSDGRAAHMLVGVLTQKQVGGMCWVPDQLRRLGRAP